MMTTKKTAAPAILTIAALTLAACSPEEDPTEPAGFEDGQTEAPGGTDVPEATTASEDDEPTEGDEEADVIYAEVDEPVEILECEEARGRGDTHVTWLDDVTIPEQRHEGVDSEIVEIDGEEVEIPGAPDIVIPQRVGQAGCIIEYEAPGACLPAVEISSAYVPGVVIPERKLPEVVLPDGTVLEETVQQEHVIEAVEREGVSQDEACQPDESELSEGDVVQVALRQVALRQIAYQTTANVGIENRMVAQSDSGVSLPQMSLGHVSSEQLTLPQVIVPQEMLEAYTVDGAEHTERAGEDTVSYITEGDVLFDTGDYQLGEAAEPELQAVAQDIAALADQDFTITVEGHTDDEPVTSTDRSFSDNYELSELRAEAVQQWVEDNVGIGSGEISAAGLGEQYPRADNGTEEGRELNRRVVITVIPESAEDAEIEYELDEAE